MSNWFVIAVVALAGIGLLVLLYRGNRDRTSRDNRRNDRLANQGVQPDYPKDRETARLANMSADDRAWETASLQRNQVNQERSAVVAAQRV